jgi:hypothetical protein
VAYPQLLASTDAPRAYGLDLSGDGYAFVNHSNMTFRRFNPALCDTYDDLVDNLGAPISPGTDAIVGGTTRDTAYILNSLGAKRWEATSPGAASGTLTTFESAVSLAAGQFSVRRNTLYAAGKTLDDNVFLKAYPVPVAGATASFVADQAAASYAIPVTSDTRVKALAIDDTAASLTAYVVVSGSADTSIFKFVEGGTSDTLVIGLPSTKNTQAGADLYGTTLYVSLAPPDNRIYKLDLTAGTVVPETLFEPATGTFDGSEDGVNGKAFAPTGLAFDPASSGTVAYETETFGGSWRFRKITLP